MSNIRETDLFLVNRNGQSYTLESDKIMANILDEDLLLVNRDNKSYKVTGRDIKKIGAIFPGINDISIEPSVPGSGTEEDPYILQSQRVAPFGASTETIETITITDQAPEGSVVWTDSSIGTGKRFNQLAGNTDLNGEWTGKLDYADIPESTEEVTYVGKLNIGLVYFQWSIDQALVPIAPATIDDVSLVESSPAEGARFTSQSFVASSQITEGEPVSAKTIDAHVDGTLSKTVKFTEPLESSGSTVIDYEAFVSNGGGGWFTPDYDASKAFDGDPNTYAAGTGTNSLTWDTSTFPLSGKLSIKIVPTIEYQISINFSGGTASNNFPANTTSGIVDFPDWYTGITEIVIGTPNSNQNDPQGIVYAFYLDDQEFIQGGSVGSTTSLTFPTGANMEGLANGDTVTQVNDFREPLESSATGTVNGDWQSKLYAPLVGNTLNNAAYAFNGDGSQAATATGSGSAYLLWEPGEFGIVPTSIEWYDTAGINSNVVEFKYDGGGTDTFYTQGTNDWYDIGCTNEGKKLKQVFVLQNGLGPLWYGIKINGEEVLNGSPLAVGNVLVFADGTDMTVPANGDEVSQTINFDEPLESTTISSVPYADNFGTVNPGNQELINPQNAFSGNVNNWPVVNSLAVNTTYKLDWDIPASLQRDAYWNLYITRNGTSDVSVEMYNENGVQVRVSSLNYGEDGTEFSNGWTYEDFFVPASIVKFRYVWTTNGVGQEFNCFGAARIDGVVLTGNNVAENLIFADGTDMQYLNEGDTVSQSRNFTAAVNSTVESRAPIYTVGGATNPEEAFDGMTSTAAFSNSTNGEITFTVPNGGVYTTSDKLVIYTRAGTAYKLFFTYIDGTEGEITIPTIPAIVSPTPIPAVSGTKNWTGFRFAQDASTGASGNTLIYAIAINGSILTSNGQLTNLFFANDTNMETLAVGDAISQLSDFTEPLVSLTEEKGTRSQQLWPQSGVMSAPYDMFNGSLNGLTYAASTTRFWWNGSDPLTGGTPDLNIKNVTELQIRMPNASLYPALLEIYIRPNDGSSGTAVNYQPPVATSDFKVTAAELDCAFFTLDWIQFTGQNQVNSPQVSAILINGNYVLNDFTDTDLTFAAGTDFSELKINDTVSQTYSFDEPLKSVSTSNEPNYGDTANLTYVFPNGQGSFFGVNTSFFAQAFDGNVNTPTSSFFTGQYTNGNTSETFNYNFPMQFIDATKAEIYMGNVTTGNGEIHTLVINSVGTSFNISDWWKEGNRGWLDITQFVPQTFTSFGIKTDTVNQPGRNTYFTAVRINGQILISNGTNASLSFDAGTDMSELAAGDVVSQSEARTDTWSNYLTAQYGTLSDPEGGFDGNTGTLAYVNEVGAFIVWEPGLVLTNDLNFNVNRASAEFLVELTEPNGNVITRQIYSDNLSTLYIETTAWTKVAIACIGQWFGFYFVSLAGISGAIKDGDTITSSITGTVSSITGTTADVYDSSQGWAVNKIVTTGEKTASGTVSTIANNSATVTNSYGSWAIGKNVTTGQKEAQGNVIDINTFDTDSVNSAVVAPIPVNTDQGPDVKYFGWADGVNVTNGDAVTTAVVSGVEGTSASVKDVNGNWTVGENVYTEDKITSGIVLSKDGRTLNVTDGPGVWNNGVDVIIEPKTTTGTVNFVEGTNVTLNGSSEPWKNGVTVKGPQKTVVIENTRLYCSFDSNGNVIDLQNNPQDPAYVTTDSNPSLTFTFPETFPSGQAPDDELPNGTTFTVDVTASNIAGTDGPVSATVQPDPEPVPPPFRPAYLTGLTTLYTGSNSQARDINNGIDLVNNDGLTWCVARNSSKPHVLVDTVRGDGVWLASNLNDPNIIDDDDSRVTSFNTSGISLGGNGSVNGPYSTTYVNWTFAKAAGYFDVVKYTGTGLAIEIPHSLNTKPGVIIVKNLTVADSWAVYHSSMGASQRGRLNLTAAFGASTEYWNDTEPDDTEFTVGSDNATGGAGNEYIAYLFAEDTPGVIKCGRATVGQVECGFKPQWVLLKSPTDVGNWAIADNKRPLNPQMIFPNGTGGETFNNIVEFNDTGFTQQWEVDCLFIAIAAPDPIPAPAGILEGLVSLYPGTNQTPQTIVNGINLSDDGGMVWFKARDYDSSHSLYDTERGAGRYLESENTNIERDVASESPGSGLTSFNSTGFTIGPNYNMENLGNMVAWTFGKAEGYFDVVKYSGNGVSGRDISHNLGMIPGMIIVRCRTATNCSWVVYHSSIGANKELVLNTQDPSVSSDHWYNTEPTDTAFTVGGSNLDLVNFTGHDYVAYLFAQDNPGIIKCGSYSGGADGTEVNLGFEPQWLFIKAANGGLDHWTLIDRKRGWDSDGYYNWLEANTGDSETNNLAIGKTTTGFKLFGTAALNQSGFDYVYVAIAAPPATRSQSAAEFSESQLKFMTYNNRRHVVCGQKAEEDRQTIAANLQLEGYTQAQIDDIYDI